MMKPSGVDPGAQVDPFTDQHNKEIPEKAPPKWGKMASQIVVVGQTDEVEDHKDGNDILQSDFPMMMSECIIGSDHPGGDHQGHHCSGSTEGVNFPMIAERQELSAEDKDRRQRSHQQIEASPDDCRSDPHDTSKPEQEQHIPQQVPEASAQEDAGDQDPGMSEVEPGFG